MLVSNITYYYSYCDSTLYRSETLTGRRDGRVVVQFQYDRGSGYLVMVRLGLHLGRRFSFFSARTRLHRR